MRSEPRDPQLLKGVLPMLVLALLTEAESYGYELVTRLQADGLSDIAAGTVYPVLTRLERERLIISRLVASSSGPARKYYVPTAQGTAELTRTASSWQQLTMTVTATLGRAGADPTRGAHTESTPEEPS
jgi:PadR family transcriptional regulator, regulatory protein PadR